MGADGKLSDLEAGDRLALHPDSDQSYFAAFMASVAAHALCAFFLVKFVGAHEQADPVRAIDVAIVSPDDLPGQAKASEVEENHTVATSSSPRVSKPAKSRGETTAQVEQKSRPDPEPFSISTIGATGVLPPPVPKKKPAIPDRPRALTMSEAEIEPDEPLPPIRERVARVQSVNKKKPLVQGPRRFRSSSPSISRGGIGNPPPRYPERARRRGVEGTTILRVSVTARGGVRDVAVYQSSGYRLLDWAAQDAVEKWRFRPARRANRPVPGTIDVTIVFKLREEPESDVTGATSKENRSRNNS